MATEEVPDFFDPGFFPAHPDEVVGFAEDGVVQVARSDFLDDGRGPRFLGSVLPQLQVALETFASFGEIMALHVEESRVEKGVRKGRFQGERQAIDGESLLRLLLRISLAARALEGGGLVLEYEGRIEDGGGRMGEHAAHGFKDFQREVEIPVPRLKDGSFRELFLDVGLDRDDETAVVIRIGASGITGDDLDHSRQDHLPGQVRQVQFVLSGGNFRGNRNGRVDPETFGVADAVAH